MTMVGDRPYQNPQVEAEPLDDQAVLIDLVTGDYHVLNETGFAIWRLCDGTRSIEAVAKIIAERYFIEYDRARDDVTSLIERLKAVNLVGIG
jgi:hypothetical protein